MISGSASCRAQRIFAFRCAHHAMPLAMTASATTAATKRRAARRPRPRGGRLSVLTTIARGRSTARSRTSAAVIVRRSRSRTSVRLTISSNSGATSGRSVLIGAGVRREHRMDDGQRVRAIERRPTRQHLVSDDAQRPEIRPRVHRLHRQPVLATCRRRVPTVRARTRELRCRLARLDLREAEVQNFQLSRRRQHQVRRFQIAMDDVGGMCGVQRVGHLRDDAGDLGHRQLTAGEASRESFSLVVRHRDERPAVVIADLVDRGDVRMIERTGRARLPQQAGRGVADADAVSGGRNLSATWRLRWVSSARYTVPIPPAPMWLMIR